MSLPRRAILADTGNICRPGYTGSTLYQEIKFAFSFDGMVMEVLGDRTQLIKMSNGNLKILVGGSEKKYSGKIPNLFGHTMYLFKTKEAEKFSIEFCGVQNGHNNYSVFADSTLVAKLAFEADRLIDGAHLEVEYSEKWEPYAIAAAGLMWKFLVIPPPNA